MVKTIFANIIWANIYIYIYGIFFGNRQIYGQNPCLRKDSAAFSISMGSVKVSTVVGRSGDARSYQALGLVGCPPVPPKKTRKDFRSTRPGKWRDDIFFWGVKECQRYELDFFVA